jgi:predicted alpha/beta superfamily hydrolase
MSRTCSQHAHAGAQVVLGLAAVACTPIAKAVREPDAPKVAAIGETLTIESRILGETRVINVYVPPDYATSKDRFPVLYMPDGGMKEDFPHIVGSVDVSTKNGIIRPVIVVGVENTKRRRDLPGPTTVPDEVKAAPEAGGNAKFRAFLRDELKPMIDGRFRTTAESAIVGESLAGLFVIETLLVEPTLFDGYIAADPSLQWNEHELARSAATRLAWWSAGPRTLYVATADELDIQEGVAMLVGALRIQAPPIAWRHEPMPHERHGTIFPTAALHGIRMVFAAPEAPEAR